MQSQPDVSGRTTRHLLESLPKESSASEAEKEPQSQLSNASQELEDLRQDNEDKRQYIEELEHRVKELEDQKAVLLEGAPGGSSATVELDPAEGVPPGMGSPPDGGGPSHSVLLEYLPDD